MLSEQLAAMCSEPPPGIAEETLAQSITLCGGLPLALCVVGSTLARQQPTNEAWQVRPRAFDSAERRSQSAGALVRVTCGGLALTSVVKMRGASSVTVCGACADK